MALTGDIDLTDNLDFRRDRGKNELMIIGAGGIVPWESDVNDNTYFISTNNISTTNSYTISFNNTIETASSSNSWVNNGRFDISIIDNQISEMTIINSDDELRASSINNSFSTISSQFMTFTYNNNTRTYSFDCDWKALSDSYNNIEKKKEKFVPWDEPPTKAREPLYPINTCPKCKKIILGDVCNDCSKEIESSKAFKFFSIERRITLKKSLKAFWKESDFDIDFYNMEDVILDYSECEDMPVIRSIPWDIRRKRRSLSDYDRYPWYDRDEEIREWNKASEPMFPWMKYLNSWTFSDYMEELESGEEKDYSSYLTNMTWLRL